MNLSLQRRRRFLNIGIATVISSLSMTLEKVHAGQKMKVMPSIFIGHGSPMNALQQNTFTRRLNLWGRQIGRPAAILVVSAHWLTPGVTSVGANLKPATIHDFGGFARELQEMQYPADGSPAFAQEAIAAMTSLHANPTQEWGLDHGSWTVLHHMYPLADIPVFQVSIDYAQAGPFHYNIGRQLAALRERGVLIIGSGNVVHNLRATDRPERSGLMASQPWAQEFDDAVKVALSRNDHDALINYKSLGSSHAMAVPTPDHYWPFVYALGAGGTKVTATSVFEGFQNGTLSMRCVQWG